MCLLHTASFRLWSERNVSEYDRGCPGDDCHYEVVKICMKTCHEMVEVSKDNPEPLTLSSAMYAVFWKRRCSDEKIQFFEKEFEEVGETGHSDSGIQYRGDRKFNIETPDVVIKGQSGADGPGRDTRH